MTGLDGSTIGRLRRATKGLPRIVERIDPNLLADEELDRLSHTLDDAAFAALIARLPWPRRLLYCDRLLGQPPGTLQRLRDNLPPKAWDDLATLDLPGFVSKYAPLVNR